jgi:hypothetical protein
VKAYSGSLAPVVYQSGISFVVSGFLLHYRRKNKQTTGMQFYFGVTVNPYMFASSCSY